MAKNSEARKVAKENAQQGLDTAFAEDDFHIVMHLMSRFPHYSYRNILILKQRCPGAQALKKYRTWFKLGRAVKEKEKAIYICSYFGDDDEDEKADKRHKPVNLNRQPDDGGRGNYRYVPLFDISQTEEVADFAGTPVPYTPVDTTPKHRDNVVPLDQDVPGFEQLIPVLQMVSPYPIFFSRELTEDGMFTGSEIIIRAGITQLRAVRAILMQMVHSLIHRSCADKMLRRAESESVVYVICQRLDLQTGGLRFQYIDEFSRSREADERKSFLNTVQKTAMFLVDSIEGEQEAQRIGFRSSDFSLLVTKKSASRMFRAGHRIWLVEPDTLGGLWADKPRDIDNHNGPFAVERAVWYNTTQRAA